MLKKVFLSSLIIIFITVLSYADIFGPTQSASDIDISDSGSYYTGTEVETALQEIGSTIAGIGSTYLKLDQTTPQTVSNGRPIFSGGIGTASITSSTGAISFDNENLLTTGTLGAGATTLDSLVVDTTTLVVNAAGYTDRVGIGTALPQSLLDVQGPAGVGTASAGILTLATKELTVVDGDELGRINFNAPLESSGTDAILAGAAIWAEADVYAFTSTANNSELCFGTATTSAAIERVRIAADGKVGLNTSTPTVALDIDYLDQTGTIRLRSTTPTAAYACNRTSGSGLAFAFFKLDIQNDVVNYNVANIGLYGVVNVGATPTLTYIYIGDAYNIAQYKFHKFGRYGVGILSSTSPTYKLDVRNSAMIDTVVFVGVGLNDCTSSGTYTGSTSSIFIVMVDSVGATDTFKWNKDGGTFTTGVAMTGVAQALSDGVSVTFAATTGHTLNSYWNVVGIYSTDATTSTFVGAGLNDAVSGGTYTGTDTTTTTYTIEIDATGTPDTFKWKQDSGSYTTGVAITGAAQTLSNGITVAFTATTGHTLADVWTIVVNAQQPMAIRTADNTIRMLMSSSGNVVIGASNTTPDYHLELYDSTNTPTFGMSDDDVAHGVTTLASTDTFFHVTSISTTAGGVQQTGFSDTAGTGAFSIKGVMTSDPTDTVPAISLAGFRRSGTGVADMAAAETVLQVLNNATTLVTVLGNGNTTLVGTVTGSSLIKTGGTSSQFLKADGSIDSNVYLTAIAGAVTTDQTVSQTIGDTTNRLTKLWTNDVATTKLSLNVVPKVWDATITPFQLGGFGSLSATTSAVAGTNAISVSQNAYYDDTDNRWEYIGADDASQYVQADGIHSWRTATAGSADAAITWLEKMNIHVTGEVGIGVSAKNWDSTLTALQIGGFGGFSATTAATAGTNALSISQNAYYDDTDNRWEYIGADETSQLVQYDGTYEFRTAAVGAADGLITWSTPLTIPNTGEILLGSLTSDPASPGDGSIWYRSDVDEFRGRINGVTYKFMVSGV